MLGDRSSKHDCFKPFSVTSFKQAKGRLRLAVQLSDSAVPQLRQQDGARKCLLRG